MDFHLEEDSKLPIYRQIADWLDGRIASGELAPGHRLLTERELCAALHVARGTVKNAYIELGRRGKIEKIQGKGTFVVGGSKEKEREAAVAAIRKTLQSLRTHGLGAQEIDDIIRREAWSRLSEAEKVHVIWVDRSPELLELSMRQISQECNVAVEPFLAGEKIAGGELCQHKFDLLATSVPCYAELVAAVEEQGALVERVALSVSSRTVGALARLRPDDRLAALYKSRYFLEYLQESLRECGFGEGVDYFCLDGPLEGLWSNSREYSAVIVPPGFTQGGMTALPRELLPYEGRLLPFEYMLDNGSLMHLKECAQRYWEKRVIGTP